MNRRVYAWFALLAILLIAVVAIDPTRILWGSLRGEAFYQGRPTSYWRSEILRLHPFRERWPMPRFHWDTGEVIGFTEASPQTGWVRETSRWEGFILWATGEAPLWGGVAFPLLDGDPEAANVLNELIHDSDPKVRELASGGLQKMAIDCR